MKNIHVLPTDKPSRLVIDTIENKLYYQSILHNKTVNVLTQNIYITSDEEIKEGDWTYVFRGGTHRVEKAIHNDLQTWKKIILTTDQDLIKDGVQAIDDEFLEWFVKNPSCEEVELKDSKIVKEHIWDGTKDGEIIWKKEIIIPKEEPKQETLEEAMERYLDSPLPHSYKRAVEFGVKWQQERSEKQIDDAYNKGFKDAMTKYRTN